MKNNRRDYILCILLATFLDSGRKEKILIKILTTFLEFNLLLNSCSFQIVTNYQCIQVSELCDIIDGLLLVPVGARSKA